MLDSPAASSEPRAFLVGSIHENHANLRTCPHAATMHAWSLSHQRKIICAITCKRWGCSYCGKRKMQGLAIRCELAAPTTFITLTCWTKAYLSPRDAFDRMRPRVSDLFRKIRKEHGAFECMKVLEAHANGFPHWHIIARCGFIPQAWLSNEWDRLCQSPIVDIRKVEAVKSVYAYVLKYLGKQHYVPWTSRRISYTRAFFKPKEPNPHGGWELKSKTRSKHHPAEWLYDRFRGDELEQLTPSAWLLPRTAEDMQRACRERQNRAWEDANERPT